MYHSDYEDPQRGILEAARFLFSGRYLTAAEIGNGSEEGMFVRAKPQLSSAYGGNLEPGICGNYYASTPVPSVC